MYRVRTKAAVQVSSLPLTCHLRLHEKRTCATFLKPQQRDQGLTLKDQVQCCVDLAFMWIQSEECSGQGGCAQMIPCMVAMKCRLCEE